MSRYAKFLIAIVGVLVTWATGEWPDDEQVRRYGSLLTALTTAVGVYLVPNRPPAGEPSDPEISEQG